MSKTLTPAEQLIEKGFKQEDVSSSSDDMFSYFKRLRRLEKFLPKTDAYRGRGNEHADIMVVSDFPDEHECNTGYVGYSFYSIYLTVFFHKIGVRFSDVYWTTALKKNYDNINMRLIKEDYKYLQLEVDTICPSVIFALGTTSISSFAQKPVKIDNAVGGEWFYEIPNLEDIPVIPIQHPRHILELNDKEFKKETNNIWQEVKKLEAIL